MHSFKKFYEFEYYSKNSMSLNAIQNFIVFFFEFSNYRIIETKTLSHACERKRTSHAQQQPDTAYKGQEKFTTFKLTDVDDSFLHDKSVNIKKIPSGCNHGCTLNFPC